MFVCLECLEDFEGPSVDYAKAVHPKGQSYGSCEFCHKINGCFDLYSGDPNWYPKKKDGEK